MIVSRKAFASDERPDHNNEVTVTAWSNNTVRYPGFQPLGIEQKVVVASATGQVAAFIEAMRLLTIAAGGLIKRAPALIVPAIRAVE